MLRVREQERIETTYVGGPYLVEWRTDGMMERIVGINGIYGII